MRLRAAFTAFATALLLCAVAHASEVKAEGDKTPEHKVTQSESFVMVAPMYATIIDAGKPSGLLMVAIGLNIPNERLRGQTEHALPVLRDAYLRNLMSFTSAAVRPWRQPDVLEIAKRMQGVTNRALHSKGAQVLLVQVAIQPPR